MTAIQKALSALSRGEAPKLAGIICEMLSEAAMSGIDRKVTDIPPVDHEGWAIHISEEGEGLGFAVAQCGGEQLVRAFQVRGQKFTWAGKFTHPQRAAGMSFGEFAPILIERIRKGA